MSMVGQNGGSKEIVKRPAGYPYRCSNYEIKKYNTLYFISRLFAKYKAKIMGFMHYVEKRGFYNSAGAGK